MGAGRAGKVGMVEEVRGVLRGGVCGRNVGLWKRMGGYEDGDRHNRE